MAADASHEEVLSDLLANYFLPDQQFDIICPHCGRLWRQCEPGGSAHRPFFPEEDQGLARALRQRLRRVLERFAGGLYRPWLWCLDDHQGCPMTTGALAGWPRGGARVIPARPRSVASSPSPSGYLMPPA